MKRTISKIFLVLIMLVATTCTIWQATKAAPGDITMEVVDGKFYPNGQPPTYGWYCVTRSENYPYNLTAQGTLLIYHDKAVAPNGETLEFNSYKWKPEK